MKKSLYSFYLSASLILFLSGVLSSCQNAGVASPLNDKVSDFHFTNQDGRPFSKSDLDGKVWIADFIFTSCKTICPPMTANMRILQRKAEEENIPLEIVSFSVDPNVDTPAKLKQFGEKFHSSFSNWDFLTGYSDSDISALARQSFKTIVKKPVNEDQVIHGTSFYLVDQKGMIVKNYSGAEKPPFNEMLSDIKKLQR
ncbi:SCO family protein [Metabacillus sp. RGM 3146]|uniref:SCO family protein n=1 Tax=Metabacillus sp. RGM 3146 TaxID=3401092 RepID=UPI003B9B0DCA